MLKSTAIRIAQNEESIKSEKERNRIYEEEVKETKRHNLVEEETKDRVDISKKEYLQLLEDLKKYKNSSSEYYGILEKIFKPFIDMKCPDEFIQDFLNGKIKYMVKQEVHPISNKTRFILIFEVNPLDYE